MAAASGLRPRFRHIANSAATLTRPDAHFDLVRPGIAIVRAVADAGAQRPSSGSDPAMTARAACGHGQAGAGR